jgi:chromosome segregation ATPase
MKPITFVCLFILVVTKAIAQDDTAAIKRELQKELNSLESSYLQLKQSVIKLDESFRFTDTLLTTLKTKRDELQRDYNLTEVYINDNIQAVKELGAMVKDLKQLMATTKKNLGSGKLDTEQKAIAKKEHDDIEKTIRKASLRNDSLQKDHIKLVRNSVNFKKQLAMHDKEIENLSASHYEALKDLEKGRDLVTRLEARISLTNSFFPTCA